MADSAIDGGAASGKVGSRERISGFRYFLAILINHHVAVQAGGGSGGLLRIHRGLFTGKPGVDTTDISVWNSSCLFRLQSRWSGLLRGPFGDPFTFLVEIYPWTE